MNNVRDMYKAAPGLMISVGSILAVAVIGPTSLLFR